MLYEMFGIRSVVLIGCVLGAALAAVGQPPSVYVSVVRSGHLMHATGTTDTNYAMGGQHTAYATLTLRSPDGRSQTITMYQAPRVIADLWMDMLWRDGPWNASNVGSAYCPVGQTTYQGGSAQTTKEVAPWVEITGTPSWNPSSVGWKNDRSILSISVSGSSNCTGEAKVMGHLSPPTNMQISWANGAEASVTLTGGGIAAVGRLTAVTDSANEISGSVTTKASIGAYPSNCTVSPPNPASAASLSVERR